MAKSKLSGHAGSLPAGDGVIPFRRRPRSKRGKGKKMLKCFDPKQTWEFESPVAKGTVFTYRAMSGPIMYQGFESVSKTALNKFVEKVTNIELIVGVEEMVDGKPVMKEVWQEFDEFIPAVHPEVNLAAQLPFQVATALFDAIWSKSSLTKQEAGE